MLMIWILVSQHGSLEVHDLFWDVLAERGQSAGEGDCWVVDFFSAVHRRGRVFSGRSPWCHEYIKQMSRGKLNVIQQ